MDAIRLRDLDLADLLEASARCGLGGACGPEQVEAVLDAVVALVDCDVAFWSWFHAGPDPGGHALVAASRRPRASGARVVAVTDRLDGHPVVSGRHQPPGTDDDAGRPAGETRGRHTGRAGVESQIGMVLTHEPGETNVVVLSRKGGTPFDERDRLLLLLLRPHVDAALRRVMHPSPEVSRRELEVLRLVRDGMTNAQVARRLGIAEATVAKHLEHVFSRTGARSRTHAVALCAELLDVD